MSNDFRLTGSGLESELPTFVEHMSNINPAMAEVFSKHVSVLRAASTEETRRTARTRFNSAVRAELLAGLAAPQEREG